MKETHKAAGLHVQFNDITEMCGDSGLNQEDRQTKSKEGMIAARFKHSMKQPPVSMNGDCLVLGECGVIPKRRYRGLFSVMARIPRPHY